MNSAAPQAHWAVPVTVETVTEQILGHWDLNNTKRTTTFYTQKTNYAKIGSTYNVDNTSRGDTWLCVKPLSPTPLNQQGVICVN